MKLVVSRIMKNYYNVYNRLTVYRNLNLANTKTSVWLLMLDCFPVTLSALLLEDILHSPFCMLDDGSLHLDFGGWNGRVASEGVFA